MYVIFFPREYGPLVDRRNGTVYNFLLHEIPIKLFTWVLRVLHCIVLYQTNKINKWCEVNFFKIYKLNERLKTNCKKNY